MRATSVSKRILYRPLNRFLNHVNLFWVLSFLTAMLGLYAIHLLRAVHEEGEVRGQVVVAYLAAEARKVFRHISNTVRFRHL